MGKGIRCAGGAYVIGYLCYFCDRLVTFAFL